MVGESHGTVGTFITEFELIKYFYENHNVKNILIETGHCTGSLLNNYIQNGDEKILNFVIKNTEGTFAYSNESANFYRSLYEYNKKLPEDQHLILYGVDVEHTYNNTGMYYLSTLLPKEEHPKEIAQVLNSLDFSLDREDSIQVFENLTESTLEYPQIYRDYLGSNFEEFILSLENINQALNFYENDDFNLREEHFTENTLRCYKDMGGKILTIFGGAHTDFSGLQGSKTVAQSLSELYGTDKGGVLSISLEYFGSKNRKSHKKAQSFNSFAGPSLANRTKKDLTLFKLDAEDKNEIIKSLAKGQQYAILIKYSPAVTPYKEL